MSFVSIASVFEKWWQACCNEKDAMEAAKKIDYPFLLKVVVAKDIPPRNPMFDVIREMGVTLFDRIFLKKAVSFPENYLFAFPERHLSVHEQRGLMSALKDHPDIKEIKELCILTSSPIIISDIPAECISIIAFQEGTPKEERYANSMGI